MNRVWSRGSLGLVVVFSLLLRGASAPAADQPATGQPTTGPAAGPAAVPEAVASADQLKSQAFAQLCAGHFQESATLLDQAGAITQAPDPTLARMVAWINAFEVQRQAFTAERRQQFEKAKADVELLLKGHDDKYAIESAAHDAYPLAVDKEAYLHQISGLIQEAIRIGADSEKNEDWLLSMRLYAALSSLEPANPLWKEKLKSATRRLRLLAEYVPDELKVLQDADTKERDEAMALLHPATQPATGQPATGPAPQAAVPATQPAADDDNDNFRSDWHDTLHGVKISMVSEALADANVNYYRPTSYKEMMTGGLEALRAVVTTRGMEKAFADLAKAPARAEFLAKLDELTAAIAASTPDTEQDLSKKAIDDLTACNAQTVNLPEEVLASEFADGALGELDQFSNMIWPSDLDEFNKTTQGEFSGVGIQIELGKDGSLMVVTPLEDSPAYRAGIQPGSTITAINGKQAKNITLNQAVRTITGPVGTHVVLTVRNLKGISKDYDIQRDTIKVASVKGWSRKSGGAWDYFVDPDQKIAYLRITNFTKTTSDELDQAAAEISQAGARALILDLRYNPGGLLKAATDVSNKFLSDGVIVSTHANRPTPNPPTPASAKPDDDEVTVPMVVLVNQYSASASEIVSGALKYHQPQARALVVGERTFGKGSVQMLFPMGDRKAYLKLTTSHYYLPNGQCIHREENSVTWGVDPDVVVEVTPEQMSAATKARQEMDILHNDGDGADAAPATLPADAHVEPKTDPRAADAQLSAALLLLRLQININGTKL